MRLSAGAPPRTQEDGWFTLVFGDSSLRLCLTKCHQVSYSKNLAGEQQSAIHIFTPSILCKLTFLLQYLTVMLLFLFCHDGPW